MEPGKDDDWILQNTRLTPASEDGDSSIDLFLPKGAVATAGLID